MLNCEFGFNQNPLDCKHQNMIYKNINYHKQP